MPTQNSSALLDFIGGEPLLSCPPTQTLPEPIFWGIHSPTITMNNSIQAALFLSFAITIAFRYSRIRLFGRTIKSSYISNHLWIWYFISIGLCATIDAVRYSLNLPFYVYSKPSSPVNPNTDLEFWRHEITNLKNADNGLLLTSTIIRCIGMLFLMLALRWQHRFRSGAVPLKDTFMPRYRRFPSDDDETASLMSPAQSSSESPARTNVSETRNGSYIEWMLISLFFFQIISLYLNVMPPVNSSLSGVFFIVFIGLLLVQQVILLVLSVVVLLAPTSPSSSSTEYILSLSAGENQPEGPSRSTKLYLVIGMFCHTVGFWLPLNLVSRLFFILTGTSTFGLKKGLDDSNSSLLNGDQSSWYSCYPLFNHPLFSLVDLFQFIGIIGGVFLFLFVRSEFKRVKERCIWYTVRRVTGTFGFFGREE
jgi:hypothetical protein